MLLSLLLPSYRNKLKNRLQHFSSVVFKVFDYFITFPATLATRSIGHDKQTEVTGKKTLIFGKFSLLIMIRRLLR